MPLTDDSGPPASAASEMSRVLGTDAIETRVRLGRASITVQRWRHDALHGRTAPMGDHVFMTYLGAPRAISRSEGGNRRSGWTRRESVTSIPAGAEARWDIDGGLDAVHAYIGREPLELLRTEHDLKAGALVDRTADDDVLGAQILRMLLPGADGTAPDTLFVEQAADLLAIHLLTAHSSGGCAPRLHGGGLASHVLSRVKDQAAADLSADISLAQLAATAGLSVFHFCRAFKQATGVAPHRWRLLRRLERAMELLTTTQLPITEVAAQVGYDDPSQLARLFKRELGRSPRTVRADSR